MKIIFILISSVLLIAACGDLEDRPVEIESYQGPLSEAEDLELYYSESATVKAKIVSAKMMEYANGDMDFPKGVYLERFDEKGNLISTLKANEAFYFKEEDKWRGRGDVVVKNMENNQELKTEELFWKPTDERIFTDQRVIITLPDQILHGKGLEAKQDFSSYEITKPEGVFYLDDE